MQDSSTASVLKKIISQFARGDGKTIESNTQLGDDIGLDSPRLIDLMLEIEDRFHITIDDDDYSNVETFGQLVELVDRLAAAKTGQA